MNLTTAQKISVATPGTPVKLSTGTTAACRIHIQTAPGNVGKVYLGEPTMAKATLAGVMHVFAIPAAGAQFEALDLEPHEDSDQLYPNQYAIDADTAADGLIVSTWTE